MNMPIRLVLLLSGIALAGCNGGSATFTNSDGTFVLSPNGTYTQTFPQIPPEETKRHPHDLRYAADPLDALPASGQWHLIGPQDPPNVSAYRVELDGVHHAHALPLAGTYTIVVSSHSISGFDKLLGQNKHP